MQIKLDADALRGAVTRIAAAIDTKQVLEMHRAVRVSTDSSMLQLCAYGFHMAAEALVDCKATHQVDFGVPADLFVKVVKELPSGEAVLKLTDRHAEIRAGSSSFKLNLIADTSIFPATSLSRQVFGRIKIDAFLKALSRVSFPAKEDGTLDYHRCVYIGPDSFAATDGLRLAVFPNDVFVCPSTMLLPVSAVSRLQRVFSGISGDGGIGSEDGGGVTLTANGIFARVRFLAIKFPVFQSVMPTSECTVATLPRQALLDAIRRVMLVHERSIPHVQLDFKGQTLSLECKAEDGSVGKDSVAILGNAQGRFNLDGAFLAEALKHLEKDELTLEFRGSLQAVILTDGETKHVLQPARPAVHGSEGAAQ